MGRAMRFLLLSVLALSAYIHGGQGEKYSEQPPWDDMLDFDKIENELKTEPIVEMHSMRSYLRRQGKAVRTINAVFIATLANGLKAVFKPERRPLHRYMYGEVAAYRASKMLGQKLVPPTVLKTYRGKRGSLQFFVVTPYDMLKMSDYTKNFTLLSRKARSDMKIFRYVFGLWDTHRGNLLIAQGKDETRYLALIDNSFILGPCRKMRIKMPGAFSETTLKSYEKLDEEKLKWIFEDILRDKPAMVTPHLFSSILHRKDRVLDFRKKVLIP